MAAKWLTPDQIIDLVMAVIHKDHTAACPYFGRAHLYTGPREEIHKNGENILHYDWKSNSNHKRAQFLSHIFKANLIDQMNISTLILNDVAGSGDGIYSYMLKSFKDQKKPLAGAPIEADRVVCINEQDLLHRTAWEKASEDIMRHCLNVEEFYMIDRQKGWKAAAKELFNGGVPVSKLVRLDRKLTHQDHIAKRSPRYCGSPAERLSQKEKKLLHFVTAIATRTSIHGRPAARITCLRSMISSKGSTTTCMAWLSA